MRSIECNTVPPNCPDKVRVYVLANISKPCVPIEDGDLACNLEICDGPIERERPPCDWPFVGGIVTKASALLSPTQQVCGTELDDTYRISNQ